MQLEPFVITLGLPFDALYSDTSSQKHQEFTSMVIQKVSRLIIVNLDIITILSLKLQHPWGSKLVSLTYPLGAYM